MRVIYDGIDLMPLETHYFDWEAVYDPSGTDYLYTKVSMATRSVVNGISTVVRMMKNGPPMNYGFGAASTDLGTIQRVNRSNPTSTPPVQVASGSAGNTVTVPANFGILSRDPSTLREIVKDPTVPNDPQGSVPNPTSTTHQAIRHRLSVPRKKLYIFYGTGMESAQGIPSVGGAAPPSPTVARLFLESPANNGPNENYPCDVKNGPFPRVFSVTQAMGDATTLLVDWGVETYINESENNEVRPQGALLSNRFAQVHAVDKNGFTTITTEGVAVFRTDFVYGAPSGSPVSPDQLRPFLFMPIPNFFTRVINYVRGREDVTGVEYSYTDTQVESNFVAAPFVRAGGINIVHSQAVVTSADLWGAALGAYERILNIRSQRQLGELGKDAQTIANPNDKLARAIRRLARSIKKTP